VVKELEASSDIAIRHLRRNFILGVLNGALFQLSNVFISPFLVLPLFVRYLTGSHILVGLVPSIQDAGWFLPQLVASRYIQHRPQKKVYYSATAIVRILSWGFLTLALFTLGGNRLLLLVIFFSLPVVSSFAALPEVVGDCGFYLTDADPEKLGVLIRKALNSDPELGRRARERIINLFPLGGNRLLLLVIFFSLLVVSSFASGVAGIPFLDIVGKTIPVTRRGSFFGGRNFFGGILAFGGGFINPGCGAGGAGS